MTKKMWDNLYEALQVLIGAGYLVKDEAERWYKKLQEKGKAHPELIIKIITLAKDVKEGENVQAAKKIFSEIIKSMNSKMEEGEKKFNDLAANIKKGIGEVATEIADWAKK